jgi:hypothetical protein
MLPPQAAWAVGASETINPTKAIGAIQSRHLVIAAASLAFGRSFFPARDHLGVGVDLVERMASAIAANTRWKPDEFLEGETKYSRFITDLLVSHQWPVSKAIVSMSKSSALFYFGRNSLFRQKFERRDTAVITIPSASTGSHITASGNWRIPVYSRQIGLSLLAADHPARDLAIGSKFATCADASSGRCMWEHQPTRSGSRISGAGTAAAGCDERLRIGSATPISAETE